MGFLRSNLLIIIFFAGMLSLVMSSCCISSRKFCKKRLKEHMLSSFFFFFLLGCGLLVLSWAIFARDEIVSPNVTKVAAGGNSFIGEWGDSFGFINALFSSFAFVGLFLTVYAQDKTINQQSELSHRQLLDSTIYRFIDIIRENRNRIKIFRHSRFFRSKTEMSEFVPEYDIGLNVIEGWYDKIKNCNNPKTQYYGESKIEDPSSTRNTQYVKIDENNMSIHFNYISMIIGRILDDKIISEEEKKQYIFTIRSQLSPPEVAIMALHAISCHRDKTIKSIIVRAHLLRYLPNSDSELYKFLRKEYAPEAFHDPDDPDYPTT